MLWVKMLRVKNRLLSGDGQPAAEFPRHRILKNIGQRRKTEIMKAVITVIGRDKIGIIYQVTSVLAEYDVNSIDINQTIMHDVFTMMMIVDTTKTPVSFEELQKKLEEKGKEMGMSIRIQHEGIFNAMSEI